MEVGQHVIVELDGEGEFRGQVAVFRRQGVAPEEEQYGFHLCVVRPAPSEKVPWHWILFRTNEAMIGCSPDLLGGVAGFTNVESPTSFHESEVKRGKAVLRPTEASAG